MACRPGRPLTSSGAAVADGNPAWWLYRSSPSAQTACAVGLHARRRLISIYSRTRAQPKYYRIYTSAPPQHKLLTLSVRRAREYAQISLSCCVCNVIIVSQVRLFDSRVQAAHIHTIRYRIRRTQWMAHVLGADLIRPARCVDVWCWLIIINLLNCGAIVWRKFKWNIMQYAWDFVSAIL